MADKNGSTTAAKDRPSVQPSKRPDGARAAGATAATPQAPQPQTPSAETPVQIPPEIRAKIGELRTRVRLNLGQVVLAIMNLPRYRHQTLGDLTHLVLDPMMRDRISIARRGAEGQPTGEEEIAGIAIWASVSEAVDAKIIEQVKAGVFPMRLASEDWASGDRVWLLDVIAGDRTAATAVLANFRQLSGDREVRIHPLVGRLVDGEILKKLRAAADARLRDENAPAAPEAPA